MKIYLDVLIFTNAVITFMYLCGLSKVTHSKISRKRLFFASFFGGCSAIIVAIESTNLIQAFSITIIKLISVLITVTIAFKRSGIKKLIRYFLLYICLNILFAGCSLLIWEMTDSKIIYIKNFTIYFDISLMSIIVATILAYIVITIYDLITSKAFSKSASYKVKYSIGEYEIILPAIADSGNSLCDSFTGIPIVVFYCNELYDHFNLDYENQMSLNGFRLVPISTVNGDGLISVTSKGNTSVIDESEFSKELRCYVGIARSGNNESRAIFNPCLLT